MTANDDEAFGRPGSAPRWTSGAKDGVGTAYSAGSRAWFTLGRGHLNEVYYPTIDMPQLRRMRLLVTDGATFLDDEDDDCEIRRLCPALGYRVARERARHGYALEKVVIVDPHAPCVLQRVRLRGNAYVTSRLRVYAICEPHLGGGGASNDARVIRSAGRDVLVAERDGRCLAMAASRPFARASAGFVGASDGEAALAGGFALDAIHARATDGNVSLVGEISMADGPEFTIGIGFGDGRHGALTTLFQSLATPFHRQASRFVGQWRRAVRTRRPLEAFASDDGNLYRASYSLLLAHEDKTYPGAQIASLSIPWGDARSDDDGLGGYHLVWTRDLVQCATGLLAAGQVQTPLRTLVYLAVAQLPDGGFAQNFWIDGEAAQDGSQLDEVAFPILLARRLHVERACDGFDGGDLVRRAARHLILRGPITGQDRWEETSGYSPSTLAAVIAACVCAAAFAEEAGDAAGAAFVLDYADWLRAHLCEWTVTRRGTLLPGVARHFVRLHPAEPCHAAGAGEVDVAELELTSQPPGATSFFPARDVVDAGFLELVRHGILAADDPLVVDSLRVVDLCLKRETPHGAAWRRYNHDGYGQRDDGTAYVEYGVGRAWPLLAGERGHYELAAGRDASCAIRAMERFGAETGLLPEQVWDDADLPAAGLRRGGPTGAARPLLWAHAEYVKLLRSVADGVPYDRFPEVAARYGDAKSSRRAPPEYWSLCHPTPSVAAGSTLRICMADAFRLHLSDDDWASVRDVDSSSAYGLHFVDVAVGHDQRAPLRFTMRRADDGRWEGRDFAVSVR